MLVIVLLLDSFLVIYAMLHHQSFIHLATEVKPR